MPAATLIEFRRVTKRFQAVTALCNVSFAVQRGEFHALCGENGAGKSTLMKVLSGVIPDYEGTIALDGRTLELAGPRDAEEQGISIIHQELNLVGQLSAAANIFLGREVCAGGVWLDDRTMLNRAQELFDQLECQIPPGELVSRLRIGDQQLVEIAKALSLNTQILIMDEPTSALTESEVARLFRVIARLRSQGVTIIYISHKMDEVFQHADHITVLRDGQVVQTMPRAETSPEEITRLMVGRELAMAQRVESRVSGYEVLRVRNLSLAWPGHARGWRLSNIDLAVHRGEVLGIAGLMGAGRTELLECLYGSSALPPEGEMMLQGRPVTFRHPAEALAAGVAMVTEDRKQLGLIPSMNVRQHITLSSLYASVIGGFVSGSRERQQAETAVEQLRIKTAGTEAAITALSGGNQQKCLIARALQTHPQLLLLDDPTRGIDVGAKAEIYRLIDELCAQGLAIIITSSELPELLTVCDRIMVLCEGRKTGEFTRAEFSEESLMAAATAAYQTSASVN
ncbi:ATP-binding cassette domain-containing protein [bacterium]|nr:ATP-binding cassette domain-containing protein [bacterium]